MAWRQYGIGGGSVQKKKKKKKKKKAKNVRSRGINIMARIGGALRIIGGRNVARIKRNGNRRSWHQRTAQQAAGWRSLKALACGAGIISQRQRSWHLR
jgi:hypothetical protein